MKVLVTDFSGVYQEEEFPLWLQENGHQAHILSFAGLEGTSCYCSSSAEKAVAESLPATLPRVRFIDSGDYHYMTHILAAREKEPFHLILLDNHTDDQAPEFGGILSCGGWVKTMKDTNPMLRSVLTIGPEGCPADIPEGWLDERIGERMYISLDKDIMSRDYARTAWTQGSHTLPDVAAILRKVAASPVQIAAVDICGELQEEKGAQAEDLRINKLTNTELLKLMSEIIDDLQRTCLYGEHVALGAKMSPFAGFMMPIQYSSITEEHLAVRQKVGMFDVSHMGEIFVEGPGAEDFVNYIFTNEIRGFQAGKVLYGMMCYPDGGVVDDLLVYREFKPESFLLVVNAANIDKDFAWIQEHAKGFDCKVRNESPAWGQIALQGPEAESTLIKVLGMKEAEGLEFYTFCDLEYKGKRLILSRTGYTGEDGFELYTTPEIIVGLWKTFLAAGVVPCGLGCRDTLRFEAGLPLYGDELSPEISPVMAGLGMFCKYEKDFIGKEALLAQKAGALEKKLVGIEIEDKAIPRAGYPVETPEGQPVGVVTTGYHSISLDKSVCFALVDKAYSALDTPLQIRIRKKTFPGKVVKKRFYQTNYKK